MPAETSLRPRPKGRFRYKFDSPEVNTWYTQRRSQRPSRRPEDDIYAPAQNSNPYVDVGDVEPPLEGIRRRRMPPDLRPRPPFGYDREYMMSMKGPRMRSHDFEPKLGIEEPEREKASDQSRSPNRRGYRLHSRDNSRRRYGPAEVHIHNDIYNDDYVPRFILSSQKSSLVGPKNPQKGQADETVDGRVAGLSSQLDPSATLRRIVSSTYEGDLSIDYHAASLAVIPDNDASLAKYPRSLFRWIHFQDKSMNLESFQSKVTSIPGLKEEQREGLTELFRRVRQKFDKPLTTSLKTKAKYMTPGVLRETLVYDGYRSASNGLTITWSCLPYFSLEQYQEEPRNPTEFSHPKRTLTQWYTPQATKAMDMRQAVCSLPGTQRDYCFNVAQVWSIVVDEVLLLTCAPLNEAEMRGDSISIQPPPIANEKEVSAPKLLVSLGSMILWSFPLEECLTYFNFMSHFWEFFPQVCRVASGTELINPEDWPIIVQRARRSQQYLELVLSVSKPDWHEGVLHASVDSMNGDSDTDTQVASHGDETSSDKEPITSKSDKNTSRPSMPYSSNSKLKEGLQVLTWSSNSKDDNTVPSQELIEQRLASDLQEMDNYLRHMTKIKEQKDYRWCREKSRRDVYQLLSNEFSHVIDSDVEGAEDHQYEDSVDLVNAAEDIFRFFLPINFDGATARKYWGAVYRLLEDTNSERLSSRPLGDARLMRAVAFEELRRMQEIMEQFTEFFEHATKSEISSCRFPDEFPECWIQLLIGLFDRFQTYRAPIQVLQQGIRYVVENISDINLENYRVFNISAIAGLTRSRLVRDITNERLNVRDTYKQRLYDIDSAVAANPLNRSHQSRIATFRQEIAAITEKLPIPPTNRTGFESIEYLVVHSSLSTVDGRIRDFDEMDMTAAELERWNINRIEKNKDRQEAAIYVFTVVTIIFLPLSAVAGILGMNTSDIRDTTLKQWVFWAVAIPLTLIVMLVSIVCAGEWNHFKMGLRKGFAFLFSRKVDPGNLEERSPRIMEESAKKKTR